MNKKLVSSLALFLTSMIWGLAFVAQSKGMDYIGPITFCALRCIFGGIFLMSIFHIPAVKNLLHSSKSNEVDDAKTRRGGIFCGLILLIAMNSQQFGLLYTTPGKAGFISALNIVIIPILQLFLGVKITPKLMVCILFAMTGMYLISVNDAASVNFGDILILISSLFYSIHTLLLSHYSVKVEAMKLNIYQFITAGILSLVGAFIFETISLSGINDAMISLLYVGIMSTAVAYTLQMIGLKNISPTIASLINSMESIFAVLGGFFILGQVLTTRELIGCVIMFLATIFAQLPIGRSKEKAGKLL